MVDINVEVAYAASPLQQVILQVNLPVLSSIELAIQQSGILQQFPELKLAELVVGVFGKKLPPSTPLLGGERIEIYRPLRIDPKTARRQRAALLAKNNKK